MQTLKSVGFASEYNLKIALHLLQKMPKYSVQGECVFSEDGRHCVASQPG